MDEPIASWREYDGSGLPPLLAAALECFVEAGYHGTSIRTIAARAGLSVPGYYHHYESKQTVLVELMQRAMADLYGRSLGADAEAGSDPTARFALHIECLALFHAHRGGLAFLASTEIRALEGAAREQHLAARDRQEELLREIVAAGIRTGTFASAQPREDVRALVTMCTGISQWYREGGEITPPELARHYVQLGEKLLAP